MAKINTYKYQNISLNKITDFIGINMKPLILVFKIAIIYSILLSSNINAQTLERHQAITAYVYNFANNIQWQNEEAINEFQFLIIGEDKDVFNEMKTLYNTRTLRGKPVNIVSRPSVYNIDGVQLIYIAKDQENSLIELFDEIEGKNILLISDNFQDKRLVMINFIEGEEETLRFEINKANIINQKLTLKADLVLFGGTEIDVAALYREGQQSLRSLQKHADNLENDLVGLEHTISRITDEVQVQKDSLDKQRLKMLAQNESLNKQTLRIQQQQKTLSNQLQLLEEKKIDIRTQNQKIQEQQNILDDQYRESEIQKEDLNKGNKLLQDQKDEILSQTKILEEQTGTIDKQQNMLVLLVIITVLVIVLVLLIYYGYKNKQKLNKVLESKVEERTIELRNTNEKLLGELTTRKQAEKKILDALEMASNAEKAANLGSWSWNPNTNEVLWSDNMCRLYGIEPSQFNPTFDYANRYTHPDDLDYVSKIIERLLTEKKPQPSAEYRILTSDNKTVWVEGKTQLLFDEKGEINEVVGTTQDITERKQIQETIVAKNKEMENYLYVASHDLRTPLVNIQGFSMRLKKQADSIKSLFADKMLEPEMLQQLTIITDEDIPKTLSFVHSSIEKMDSLINGLLQLSRTGRVEMNIQKIDMNALFATILQSLDFQIKESQCKIHINPLAGCYGDAALLDQLFANIISNALKYADSERPLEITIDAKNIHNKLVYTIRDTGKGIEQKYLDKIWDIFYRIDPRSGKTGEGIGLSLVKRIAEKHKGKVWVESEENKGSVFHIELHNRKFTEF